MPATQVFFNQLNPVAGYYGVGMLQKVVGVKSGEESKAVSGRCGYLDANGEWVAGPPPAKTGPAFFVWRGTNQPDVLNDGNAVDGSELFWVAPNVVKRITCFAATGGFEFQTTEYDTNASYANGDALTVDSNGKLVKTTAEPYSTTVIVGFATPFMQHPENLQPTTSARVPVGSNVHRRSVLNFHTCYYAARSA